MDSRLTPAFVRGLWFEQTQATERNYTQLKRVIAMRTWDLIPLQRKDRQAIEQAVVMLESQFPVSNVILFGSKVRGEGDEHSDIDFLLVTSRTC